MNGFYRYDKNIELYTFDGSLEKFLIDRGVSANHIDKMKKKKLESSRSAYQIYSGEETSIELVPLDKVIGTSRGTPGWSVFDNVNKMFNSDREPSRFTSCLNFLNGMSLSELRKSYEKLSAPVRMTYYIDDNVYFLEGDGNHRTLTAMLIGAENILAKVTKTKCDNDKKEKFYREKDFRKKYKIIEIREHQYSKQYEMTFADDLGHYIIDGFEGKKEDENVLELISRLTVTINRDKKLSENLRKCSLYKKIALFYFKKKDFKYYSRLIQYIEKQYIESDDFRPLYNYQIIYLHNL